MRRMVVRAAGLGSVAAAAMLVGCGPKYTVPQNMSREDAAVDVLDCQKAGILKYKSKRQTQADAESPEAKQAARTAAKEAMDRCLKARGWKKNE